MYDLGSSSFQVLVCETGPGQTLRPALKRRSLLNLGLEVGSKGAIPPLRVKAAVAAVKRLRRALDDYKPDVVVALATAALRDATNGPEVVARLEKAIGTRIRTLDGEEEARLCFVGQRASVYVGDDPTLGIDLGGGSFELAIGNCFEIYATASATIGATRLKGELGTRELLTREDRKEVRERCPRGVRRDGPGFREVPKNCLPGRPERWDGARAGPPGGKQDAPGYRSLRLRSEPGGAQRSASR